MRLLLTDLQYGAIKKRINLYHKLIRFLLLKFTYLTILKACFLNQL